MKLAPHVFPVLSKPVKPIFAVFVLDCAAKIFILAALVLEILIFVNNDYVKLAPYVFLISKICEMSLKPMVSIVASQQGSPGFDPCVNQGCLSLWRLYVLRMPEGFPSILGGYSKLLIT